MKPVRVIGKQQRTDKQKQIMSSVLQAASEGKFLTVDEIASAVPYEVDYHAMRVSLRFLIDREFLVKDGKGKDAVFIPTTAAYDWFRII